MGTMLDARRLTAGLLLLLAAGSASAQAVAPREEERTVSFTVVYDNNPYDDRLRTAWGFACLVETGTARVLFDTGGEGSILLGNMAILGFDPLEIDAVVLSHSHADHTGGLGALLDRGARPVVYVPASFAASFRNRIRAATELVEVTGPREIVPGIHTTGQVGDGLVEQALVVETSAGLVVVTGCAHPGVVEMVRRAREYLGDETAWVIGGFHLGGAGDARIEGIIGAFRSMGVRRVAPCHCTGERARELFARAFGAAYSAAGVGWTVSMQRDHN